MRNLFFLLLLSLYSCRTSAPDNSELSQLKKQLSDARADISRMPIYADPATGDYEDLKNGVFSVQDSAQLALISGYKNELESFIVQQIDSAPSFMYLAAYLKYSSAVPVLKHTLLRKDYFGFYGWEKGTSGEKQTAADRCNEQLQDHEYPYQMAAIAAIEYISGKSLAQAAPLTNEEDAALSAEAKQCTPENMEETDYNPACLSCWLLYKFKGQKPPLITE